jgi:hypothetical protein
MIICAPTGIRKSKRLTELGDELAGVPLLRGQPAVEVEEVFRGKRCHHIVLR